jgi:polyisoprenoid-binding protein YceI
MATLKHFVMLAALCVLSFQRMPAPAAAQSGKVAYAPVANGAYQIDPNHSTVGFAVRHLEINWVTGRFRDYKGTINYDAADVTKSSVEFVAKVESIDTGVAARDTHLRNADFFDVPKYPEMTFKSTRVERKGKTGYVLHGNLTIKDVTKAIAFPFTMTGVVKDARGNTRWGIEAQPKINRRDFGINYGSALPAGGLDIGNEVTINLHLEALQPAPKPAGQ